MLHSVLIDRGRGPEIAGTRITIYDVLDYHRAGWHPTAIAATLDVSSQQVQAALQYIADNETEVMARYQEILDRIARGNSPEVLAKLSQSRAKLRALEEKAKQALAQENGHAGDPGGR